MNLMEHHHVWELERASLGVSKGTCACGAVKYFANAPLEEWQKKADELNKTKEIKSTSHPWRTLRTFTNNKEEIMSQEIITLPPVPPKPTGGGRGKGVSNMIVRDYYDTNRAQILAEVKEHGKKATRKRWNIPASTLSGLLKRWKLQSEASAKVSLGNKPEPIIIKPKVETVKVSTPSLPAFSDSWQPEVQIQWLKLYEHLFAARG